MKRFRKLIPPLLGSVAMAILLGYQEFSSDNTVTPSEMILLVIQVITVVSVWGAANIPGWEKGKSLQAAVFVVLGFLVTAITGGIQGDEWVQLAVLGLSALGVQFVRQPLSVSAGPGYHRKDPPASDSGW